MIKKYFNHLRCNIAARLFLLLVTIVCCTPLHAQDKSSSGNSKKTYPPGWAWTLETPLGLHEKSTIDTLLYNYQHQFIPTLQSDAFATTGQLTGPGLDMIYFNRPERLPFLFNNAVEHWIPSFNKTKFYNVYIPMTLLSYNFSTGRESHSDLLRGVFSGNVNRNLGIGAWVDYPYTKGCYTDQAAKELSFGITGYWNYKNYELQVLYNHYRHLNKENGGITDDLYITDPAVVQGGVSDIEPKSIPVNLSNVHNLLCGQQFYMSHAYCLGFNRDITQPQDTVERTEFVPVTKIIYSLDFQENKRRFTATDRNSASKFWQNTYFNPQNTDETTKHWSLSNTFGIQMIEGFQKWAPFGLSAWVTYELDRYWFLVNRPQIVDTDTPVENIRPSEDNTSLTPLPEGFDTDPKATRNRLWVGARLAKTKGKTIRYYAEGRFGLIGDAAGEITAKGNFISRFRLGKDTVEIAAEGFFKNESPDWLLNHYVGNHFVWNNNFAKIRSFRVGGHLYIPWTKTELKVNFENVQNHIYFNPESLPQQYGGSVQIFSASIDQKLRFGIWNWNNTITYQTSSNKDILPLPTLTIYSNMFLNFKVVRVLTVQIGVDCDYYTRYRGMTYQPATMTFGVQGENAVEVGNYPFCNVYLTCKLSKVRFFVMCSHINQDWFGRNYFSMPHYPVNPRQFRLGLSVDFAN